MNPDTLRILDANFNRAREGLRVAEDYARFVLNDPALTHAAKKLRHDLVAAVREFLPERELLLARDTPGDVGTALSTPGETARADARAVLAAATRRVGESLRALEEYGKTLAAPFAARIEALRYQAYTLESHLLLRTNRRGRMRDAHLCVLLSEALCTGEWHDVLRRITAAGADCVQLREKGLADAELLRRAQVAAQVCRETGTLFLVNDRPDVARLAGADGVHLGQDDLPPRAARRIVGDELLIGLSTHTPAQVEAALHEPIDYVAVGPMYPSSTKPQDVIAGPDLLDHALARTELPIVCIGGVGADNVGLLLSRGATCIAVCSAVLSASDPAAATALLRSLIGQRS